MSKKNNYFSYNFIIIYFIIIIIIIDTIYAYSTYFEKEITIKNLNFFRNNSKNLINSIVDDENNVYQVQNSIYYGFFTSAELYLTLKENNRYKIKGNGLRISFLSMFPNIISAEKIN